MTNMQWICFCTRISRLSGTLPNAWSTMTNMQHLKLYSNPRLSGTLPNPWSTMTQLRILDLHNNHLRGTLPRAGPFADTIFQLSLKSNTLDGTLPPSWGPDVAPHAALSQRQPAPRHDSRYLGTNLTDLQVFTAQNNRLGGTIPEGLLAGDKRCIVLLNDNQLRGRIVKLSPGFFRRNCTISAGQNYLSWFRPSLLLHNNRLSCALPAAPTTSNDADSGGPYTLCENRDHPPLPEGNFVDNASWAHDFNSLLLPGNRFQGTLNDDGSLPSGCQQGARGPHCPGIAVLVLASRRVVALC